MRAGERQQMCSIWGPTCDALDVITDKCLLPEMDVGEWIIFRDMGAYTMSVASSFHDMDHPKCYYFLSEQDWYACPLFNLLSLALYIHVFHHGGFSFFRF